MKDHEDVHVAITIIDEARARIGRAAFQVHLMLRQLSPYIVLIGEDRCHARNWIDIGVGGIESTISPCILGTYEENKFIVNLDICARRKETLRS